MRIAVVGATGALGAELLAALDEAELPLAKLVPIATDRSLGTDVEMRGDVVSVETELSALRGADLAFLCAPPAASLEAARLALQARIAAIDCSGALALRSEVPLVAELGVPGGAPLDAPILAVPPGVSLACARVLGPLGRAFGLRRAIATVLESASGSGRAGVQTLSEETIALLSQQDLPEPSALGHPVAFDVLPWAGEIDDEGTSAGERALSAVLARALGDVAIAATVVRVPVFCGEGVSLAVETGESTGLARIVELLAKTEGVDLASPAPTSRGAAGAERVHVGRLRADPSHERGVLLWLATDGLRLTAAHAVRVAEARFRRV
jgi:aspartate-semialdehyde dehydrogenase